VVSFAFSGSSCSVRAWRMVRLLGADDPRDPVFVKFVACLCEFLVRSVEAFVSGWSRFGRQTTREVRTVRERGADSPCVVDSSQVGYRRSVF
jgi:hypothetical protein